MNCPKCKSDLYVASPCVDNGSAYGTSSNGDPNQVMKHGWESTHICTKCNVWFKVKQDFENGILIKEKIEWEIRKDQLIPATGSSEFWKRWETDKVIKARKIKLEKINEL